jgi:rod shape determining protein RodA
MRTVGLDRPLILTSTLLLAFGLTILYSAGQTDVSSLASGAWQRQLAWALIGLGAGTAVFRLSFRVLEWSAPALYGLAVFLLVLVLIIGTGAGTAASSKSWLTIGGTRLGQPAEFAKLAAVIMLAKYLAGLRDPPESLRDLLTPCLIAGVPFLLVLRQPDLGSAMVFGGILLAMLYWRGTRPWLLVLLLSPVVSLLSAFNAMVWGLWMVLLAILLLVWRPYLAEGITVYVINMVMGAIAIPLWKRLAPYQQNRLLTFLNPEVDPTAAGYHAIQSKVAIGSGGWLGNGFLQGPQKRLAFLPEQHTDFIFPVLGEELGFLGVAAALALFFLFFLVILRIARRSPDPFSSLVAFGLLGLYFTHVFENVGMTANIMPITGIPLPFFSYGGSFLLVTFIALGLLLRVAWDSQLSGYLDI